MPQVQDVAEYILKLHGPMSAMKLQKLCYYAQAWSLVWDDRPLFEESFEAWANGPVSPVLYSLHCGEFNVTTVGGDPSVITDPASIETLNVVIEHYGKMTAAQLSELTHAEQPWKGARKGLPEGVRSSNVIELAAMVEYYGGLTMDNSEVV